MPLFKYLFAITVLLSLAACKKETLYFQKVERVESNTKSRLNKIKFVNDSLCLIAGGERFQKAEVLASTDGGFSWSVTEYPEVGKGIYEIETSATGSIYLSAFDAKFLISRNNAQAWEYKDVGTYEFYVGMSFAHNNRMVLTSREGQQAGKITVTDSNLAIQKVHTYPFGLNDVQMATEQTGYVAGYGTILKTTDGGESWEYMDVKNDNFLALYCRDENEVWACGYNGTIVHTTDGGKTWDKLRNGNNLTLPKFHMEDIVFKDAQRGYAVGEDGLVVYTSDGGKNWARFNKFTENAFHSIAICPDGTLLVAGDNGVIYRLHL